MATAQIVVFCLFSLATGLPLTAQTPTFLTYEDETGANITPAPAITEVGGGLYRFTPNFTAGHGAAYVVDCGASSAQRYLYGYLRPEDYYPDMIADLEDEVLGKWQVVTTGADANRLVLYRQDGSVLKKFDLQDAGGQPSTAAPFSRIPV